MSVADSDIKKAQEQVGNAVLDKARSPNQASSGEEPPSGFQGKGTVDEPYDQGNQPEQSVAPNTEPVSGKQGQGTVDKPYDQGNQAGKQTFSAVDLLELRN